MSRIKITALVWIELFNVSDNDSDGLAIGYTFDCFIMIVISAVYLSIAWRTLRLTTLTDIESHIRETQPTSNIMRCTIWSRPSWCRIANGAATSIELQHDQNRLSYCHFIDAKQDEVKMVSITSRWILGALIVEWVLDWYLEWIFGKRIS